LKIEKEKQSINKQKTTQDQHDDNNKDRRKNPRLRLPDRWSWRSALSFY
jgi:hypothetical protein